MLRPHVASKLMCAHRGLVSNLCTNYSWKGYLWAGNRNRTDILGLPNKRVSPRLKETFLQKDNCMEGRCTNRCAIPANICGETFGLDKLSTDNPCTLGLVFHSKPPEWLRWVCFLNGQKQSKPSVDRMGFEPTTTRMQIWRSTNWSYRPAMTFYLEYPQRSNCANLRFGGRSMHAYNYIFQ